MDLYVTVVGMVAGGRESALQEAYLRHPVLLAPEPFNKFDPNAIAVYLGRSIDPLQKVGYIPKDVAARLSLPANFFGEVADIRYHPDNERLIAGLDVKAPIKRFLKGAP